MVTLKDVTIENWNTVIRLRTSKEQSRFVADNCVSLAQAHYQKECIPLAIYDDDVAVGFTMYCLDPVDREYWIFRLMVDAKHQSKGYGRKAMELLVERIKEDKDHHRIYISFEPENIWAKKLYASLGFVPDGRVVDGEIVYQLIYGH